MAHGQVGSYGLPVWLPDTERKRSKRGMLSFPEALQGRSWVGGHTGAAAPGQPPRGLGHTRGISAGP